MKKVIFLAILFLPAIGYLILRTGKNQVDTVPYFGPRQTIELTDGSIDTNYHKVPEFAFSGHTGETITNETFDGNIYVTDFFFTTCKLICPKMTTQLMRVQNEFKSVDDVKLLSHTVHPAHDSVEVLNDYAAQYGAIDGKWYFVTGEKEKLYNIALKGYFLMAGEEGDADHQFLHSENFILVDKDGHLRGIYAGTDVFEVNRLIDDINALLYHYKLEEKELDG